MFFFCSSKSVCVWREREGGCLPCSLLSRKKWIKNINITKTLRFHSISCLLLYLKRYKKVFQSQTEKLLIRFPQTQHHAKSLRLVSFSLSFKSGLPVHYRTFALQNQYKHQENQNDTTWRATNSVNPIRIKPATSLI